MRRPLAFSLLALAAASPVAGVATAASDSGERGSPPLGRGVSYFAIGCAFSHRNQDDPIVFPGQRGRSHDHTYFGNRSTNASSTPPSLRAAGETTCRLRADPAAYWAPTLFVGGRAVEPFGAIAYYVRRTLDPVQAFPANLKVIAGSAAARSPQARRVTFWSCTGRSGVGAVSEIPACPARTRLLLQVNFPNCWDGRRLDSANHQSHMAYADAGVCPSTHPVEVPQLRLLIGYPTTGGGSAELSSVGDFSAHADFVNAWNQEA